MKSSLVVVALCAALFCPLSMSTESQGSGSGSSSARASGSSQLQTWRGVREQFSPSAPLAARRGAAEGNHHATRGFACESGQWGMQGGMVKCLTSMERGVSSFGQGKEVLVNLALPTAGASTGTLMRLVGGSTDLRVDLFDPQGALRGSCYLYSADQRCDLGSPSVIYPALGQDPRYPADGSMYSAFDLVTANRAFTGSLAGSALQDSYVVSVRASSDGLQFYLAGVFFMPTDSRGATYSMRPVYATSTLSLGQMAMLTNGAVWTIPSSSNAPTP